MRQRQDAPDFRSAAEAVIDLRAKSWKKGGKSRDQWRSSLAHYAYPIIGAKRVDRITSADVLAVVQPIWSDKRETASRVRQRISTVLKWCIAKGYRSDDPAGDAVLQALPTGTGRAKQHHRALPYREVPAALQRIRKTGAWVGTKLAFEFLVFTAARSGEVRNMTWDEIDLEARMWTVPAERMKAKVEHRVPLSNAAIDVLRQARAITDPPILRSLDGCPWVFPSIRGRLSNSTLSKLVRENGIAAVPHGFRSSFRDWASEQTNAPHAVMEAALAHTIPSAAERAYARSDLFEKRRVLMERWARYLQQAEGEVVQISSATA